MDNSIQGFTDPGTSIGSNEAFSGTAYKAADPVQNQQQAEPDNPAWKPFLDELPEMFQTRARPHLREWDKHYRAKETELNDLRKQYEPYQQYIGVDPQAIQYSLGLLSRVQNNPMDVYNALAEHLRQQGLLKTDTVQNQGQDTDQQDLNLDPRYAELERRQQEIDQRQQTFEQTLQQQEQERLTASYEDAINQQVAELQQKYGNALDPVDLLQRMYMQVQRGEDFDAAKAFEEQRATFQRMYAAVSGNGRSAPNVLPPGGAPVPNGPGKSPKDMNETERKAYFKQLLDAANAGG